MEGSGQPSISRVTPGSTARLLCPALASSSVCGGRGAPLAAAPQPWLPQAPLYLPSPSLTLQTEPPASVSGAVSNTLWAKQRSGGSVLTSPWPQGRPGPSTLGVITALWPRCPGSDSTLPCLLYFHPAPWRKKLFISHHLDVMDFLFCCYGNLLFLFTITPPPVSIWNYKWKHKGNYKFMKTSSQTPTCRLSIW